MSYKVLFNATPQQKDDASKLRFVQRLVSVTQLLSFVFKSLTDQACHAFLSFFFFFFHKESAESGLLSLIHMKGAAPPPSFHPQFLFESWQHNMTSPLAEAKRQQLWQMHYKIQQMRTVVLEWDKKKLVHVQSC